MPGAVYPDLVTLWLSLDSRRFASRLSQEISMCRNSVFWSFLFEMVVMLECGCATIARAEDWPQWRGVHRDAVSHEKGLLQEWSKEGPRQEWKATELGNAYSSRAVAGGQV